MIDPSSAPKISSMDASLAGSASSQRNDAKAANGFDDALSSAGHSGRNRQDRADAVSGGETEAEEARGAEAEGAETRATKGTRPAIDVSAALSRTSIAGTVVGRATTAAAAAAGRTTTAIAATTDTPAAATDAAQSDTGTQALGEDGPATDIAAARKAARNLDSSLANPANGTTGETLDGAQVAAVVQHVQAAKGDKTERAVKAAHGGDTDAASDTDTDTNTETEAGAAATGVPAGSDLGDMLTLLTHAAASAPQVAPRADHATARAAASEATAVVASSGALSAAGAEAKADLPSVDTADTGTAGATEADRSFRFLRADGKGQTLAMRVGPSDGETVKYDIGSAKDGGQTVAVLDARRYIAPASTNAATITAAMMGDGEWASAMLPGSELANAASLSSSGKVVNTLKLQMSPIELGNVTATLRLSGDELTVQITVETHAAHKALSEDQGDMLKALRAQGFTVDQIQVGLNVGAADRADSGQTGAQGQSSGQQAQGGAQGGNGNNERRTATTQAESGTGMGKATDDASALQATPGGAGASRPGHVYI